MAVTAAILALASLLPPAPQPAAPFPKIVTDAPSFTDVAPGVAYGEYRMRTVDGPLSVHVVAINLHEATIRIGTTLAQNRLVSSGETTSSMGARTGAVAGINGDYFDINQTNQPLNILVSDTHLIRVPMKRWAIAFDANKTPRFAEYDVSATAQLPQGELPLRSINEWPPPGGRAVLMTPQFGGLRAAPGVTEVQLDPVGDDPPFGQYRVQEVFDGSLPQPPGYYLALGAQASAGGLMPQTGDTLSVSGSAVPSLDGVVSAIGGGPLLVKNGAWYADPDGPSKGEFATHMPASAVGVTHNGTLLMFEVDGRQPALSIGVLQPQLASLMIAFDVVTGMQFDGGGSSTLIARLPGQHDASVQNSPSDRVERRVADALMIYSDAPVGPPARMYASPQTVRALPGARVALNLAVTDAGVHPASCGCVIHSRVIPEGLGKLQDGAFVAGTRAGDGVIRVTAGTLQTQVAVHVTTSPALVQILPPAPALRAGESVKLEARAYDAHGYPIAIPSQPAWSSSTGHIGPDGTFTAANTNATVSVALGTALARANVIVGEHTARLPLSRYAQFASAPRDGPGAAQLNLPCDTCVTLRYDFTQTERAAYANASFPLPQRALALSVNVFGDGNGEILRLAVNNAINERFLYTLAKIDWRGWRHVEFRFPDALPQPLTFKSIYVINRVGPGQAVKTAGSIALADLRVILAGSAQNLPK